MVTGRGFPEGGVAKCGVMRVGGESLGGLCPEANGEVVAGR